MNGEKTKIIIIYALVLVVIGLFAYLIYLIYDENKPKPKKVEKEEISQKCTFNTIQSEFNNIAQGTSELQLCAGYNKININDIALGNVYIIYYNGTQANESSKLGVYLNDKKISLGASFNTKNYLYAFNNVLFIKKETIDPNVLAFNQNGEKIYDLSTVLVQNKLDDPVFIEKAKTDQTKMTRVTVSDIDSNSFIFKEGEFTFNTTSECKEKEQFKGSTYKVTYNNETFTNPVFVSNVGC